MTQNTNAVNTPAPGVAGAQGSNSLPTGQVAPAPATSAAPSANQPAPSQAGQPGASPNVQGGKQDSVVPLSALHEERTKRQALADEVSQLRAALEQIKNPQVNTQNQHANADASQGMTQEQIDQLWEDNPKQAVRTEMMMAFNWYDSINTNLERIADSMATQYPDFNGIRGMVMNQVRTLPVDQRTPQAVQQAYFVMRGQNLDSIIKQREAEWQARISAPAGFQVPSAGTFGPGAATPNTGVSLTDEQLRVADAMGLTPEAYAGGIVRRPA